MTCQGLKMHCRQCLFISFGSRAVLWSCRSQSCCIHNTVVVSEPWVPRPRRSKASTTEFGPDRMLNTRSGSRTLVGSLRCGLFANKVTKVKLQNFIISAHSYPTKLYKCNQANLPDLIVVSAVPLLIDFALSSSWIGDFGQSSSHRIICGADFPES